MKILTIVVGSYEGSMYCFKQNLDWMNYTKHFSVNDSTGAVRSLALKNGMIYCGSKDESLRLYNHNKKQAAGVMSGHTGTVFKIVDTSKYLISGDDNGHVLIWGHRNKALYHILETGKHGLLDYDVHTSEKLLITIGPESPTSSFYVMKVWNLSTCKSIFQKKFKKRISLVKFLPNNDILLIEGPNQILQNIDTLDIKDNYVCDSNINALQIHGNFLIALCESGNCYVWQIEDVAGERFKCFKFTAFESIRGKAMDLAVMDDEIFLTAISTEGNIKIFEIGVLLQKFETFPEGEDVFDLGKGFEEVYSINISSRLLAVGTELVDSEAAPKPRNPAGQQAGSELKDKKAKVGSGIDKKISGKAEGISKPCMKGCCGANGGAKNSKELSKKDMNLKMKNWNFMQNWCRHAELFRKNGLLRLNKQRMWHKRELDLAL